MHKLRIWDQISTPRVHHFIANSKYIASRISHVYNRDAEVIYPPVDVLKFVLLEEKDDFYFAASRMVPYKKMELIAEAFKKMPVISDMVRNNKKNIKINNFPSFLDEWILFTRNFPKFIEKINSWKFFP